MPAIKGYSGRFKESGAQSQGVKDGRKSKKNWKGRREVDGSDMDAFIDKMDEPNSEAVESNISRTNSALETSTETAVNGASVLESSVGPTAFEEHAEAKQVATTAKDAESTDSRNAQKDSPAPDSPSEVSLGNGYTKDKDSVSTQKNHEHQKQVENKQKQKKKKKKGHHSPPNQKSKQSTSSHDLPEKQNEAPDADKKLSPTSVTDNKDSQDKSAAQENKSAAKENKSAAKENKSATQDLKVPSTSPPPTPETVKDKEISPQPSALLEEEEVDRKAPTSPKEEESIKDTSSTTDSVISVNSLDSSKNLDQQVTEQTEGSIASDHLLQHNNTPLDRDVDDDVPAVSVQASDSTGDISVINSQVFSGESDFSRNSVSKEDIVDTKKEQTFDADSEAKSSSEKAVSKPKRGGKEKLQYDKTYLMQLRDCPSSQIKPEGLPDLEIILDLPIVNTNRGSNADFTPSFFQPGGNLRGSQIGKTNSRSRQRPDMQMSQRVIKSVSLQDSVKPLHHSEKPWKPTPKQLSSGELSEKKRTLESEILFIMNRLTPTNFERLAEEMKKLNIKTYEDLKELVRIVFDKVTIETKFVEAYAKLCKVMSGLKVPPPNSGMKESQATFRVVMLTKCQQEFEADKTTIFEDPEEKRKKLEAEIPDGPDKASQIDTALYHMKMRRLKFYGNIRFIGELFKLGLLTENIMHDCIIRLLKAKDDDSLVSLCNLISTVGQVLDTEKSKSRMDHYFAQMAKISDERKSRIKFTLKDIIDLRSNNWVPRKEQTGPKKIDEVHKDFQQEQATKQFLQSQPLPPRTETPQQNNRRGSRQRQDDKQPIDDGWNTVGSKSQRIDVSKMRLSKNVVDENSIQLGPGGGMKQLSIWSKGSYGGAQPSQDNERPVANRFSALRGEEERRSYQRSPSRGDSGVAARGTRQGPTAGHGRGKIYARSSQEGDRRDALANARSNAGGRSQNSSRDNSWNREDRRQPVVPRGSREGESPLARSNGSLRPSNDSLLPPSAVAAASLGATAVGFDDDLLVKKSKPLSEEEMEQKAKTILEEYLNAMDLEEAKLCVKELESQAHLTVLVTTSINEVLEKSNKARDLTGSFFHEIVTHGLLPLDVYLKGLADMLSYAEDMVIDIPKMWTYLAQIIVPMLVGGTLSWPTLSATLLAHLDRRCCAKLVAEILLVAKEKTSEREVAEMWQSSNMDWATFLDPEEMPQFLKDKKLQFTVEPVAGAPANVSGSSLVYFQKLIDDIESIVRRKGSNQEICACIDKYAGAEKQDNNLIRAIVTAIVNASISPTTKKLSEDTFKSRREVLQHYIRNKLDLELQALYAIQALMHKLEHPSGVITTIFDFLYDEEVISEEAIKQWEMSTDPQEAEGKGACSMQLTQFFTWLRENEEPEGS